MVGVVSVSGRNLGFKRLLVKAEGKKLVRRHNMQGKEDVCFSAVQNVRK